MFFFHSSFVKNMNPHSSSLRCTSAADSYLSGLLDRRLAYHSSTSFPSHRAATTNHARLVIRLAHWGTCCSSSCEVRLALVAQGVIRRILITKIRSVSRIHLTDVHHSIAVTSHSYAAARRQPLLAGYASKQAHPEHHREEKRAMTIHGATALNRLFGRLVM